jgi:hypothetical protein
MGKTLEEKVIESLMGSHPIAKRLAQRKLERALEDYKKELNKLFKDVSHEDVEMMDEEEYESKYGSKLSEIQEKIRKKYKIFDIDHDEYFFTLTLFQEPFMFTIDQDGKLDVELDPKTESIIDICQIVFEHMKGEKKTKETCYMCGNELEEGKVVFDGDGLACKDCIEESKRLLKRLRGD